MTGHCELSTRGDSEIIDTDNRGPALVPHWTVAKDGQDGYEKILSIEDFVDYDLGAKLSHEIEMCDVIRRHPHLNLATYYGCVTVQDKVSGLLFKRCLRSLLETVNPQGLSKQSFLASGQTNVLPHMRKWLVRLREAVDHLHSLGYTHNDLTPSNIMLDDQGSLVIVDFGSMCRVGDSLAQVKRTMEWNDQTVTHTAVDNDFDARAEIETWLFGSTSDLKFSLWLNNWIIGIESGSVLLSPRHPAVNRLSVSLSYSPRLPHVVECVERVEVQSPLTYRSSLGEIMN